ncbi:MAG TPA: hypothetical protein VM690_04120, partial [Gaiellaceae bacterium]|nr:hypothetical protein [Gaiellaceae bacterium]
RVGFVAADGSLQVASRAADGTWSTSAVSGLPGARSLVVGIAVRPDGSSVVLAEDPASHWLALTNAGRAVVAYAYEVASGKTWLRLVTESTAGALTNEAVTKLGFPKSDTLPAVAPIVLASGAIRVEEAYANGTIEWARTRNHKDWIGQFVYTNSIGLPAGVVQAVSSGVGVWSAWTELFPSFDESQLLLTLHAKGEHNTVLHHHAFLVGLVVSSSGPELAADDYVDLNGHTVYAGLVVGADGTSVELAGDLEGYALDGAARQYLLVEPDGLEWYRAATPPTARVDLSAAVSGASFTLSGHVTGAAGGTVELWQETQSGATLAASLPLAADGSFTTTDLPPTRPLTYRAIYRDPANGGLPLASLVRTVLGQ